MSKSVFKFKNFMVTQSDELHKIGTDAMLLGAFVDCDAPKTILDVGTGSGVIALMLAQRFPKAKIIGIDIDDNAVAQADENFKKAPFQNLFTTETIDFLNYHPPIQFDLIVSNPPYFNTKMPSNIEQRNRARHENRMTLLKLINHAAELMSDDGEFWLIVPKERTEELIGIKERLELCLAHRIFIFGKPNRHVRDILVFTRGIKKKDLPGLLTIRDDIDAYTADYKSLTKRYHNKIV